MPELTPCGHPISSTSKLIAPSPASRSLDIHAQLSPPQVLQSVPGVSAAGHCALDDLGVLRLGGADTRPFLQGQLSQDMQRLQADALLPAGLHLPTGRTLALLWLTVSGDDVLAVLPRELLATVMGHLRRYILRAKVRLEDASEEWRVLGGVSAPLPANADTASRALRFHDDRSLYLLPAATPLSSPLTLTREQWRALDIAAGLPQVYAATSGAFVAQMLNLDCIGAIAFDKGCYTGQEVIARSHYRGRVKRRMQRFHTPESRALPPAATGMLSDGRRFEVVDSVANDAGGRDFLAVTTLTAEAAASAHDATDAAGRLPSINLPLPYALEEPAN